jgi:DNA-3-methyladenine glycosylase
LAFYARGPLQLAPDLLGKILVHDVDGRRAAVRLVEVEAYGGADDPGSHGYRRRTRRNDTMFGPPGRLYVYFTYGMHWCANVVCGSDGVAGAVLLRAGEPVEGIEFMRARRPKARRDRDLTAGPARLCEALVITGDDDAVDLRRGGLRIVDDGTGPGGRVRRSTRIGLSPGNGDDRRWRWVVERSVYVSRAR